MVKQTLHIPEDVRALVATPLAYPVEASYKEAAQERLSKRTRTNLKNLVHTNHWSESEPA
jgi:hypothetical protein